MLGLGASTLRAWEDRYAVVVPIRSGGAQRLYSRAQVEQLRFLKARIEAGVSAADAHRLLAQELAAGSPPAPGGPHRAPPPPALIPARAPHAAGPGRNFRRTAG